MKDWDAIIVGTGDHSPARAFYEANGYEEYGRRPGFFDRYARPVVEGGHILHDMVMYRKSLSTSGR